MAFVYAWIVPSWVHQLLPQLLMEQFDTLPIQCRHIEHMHEGVKIFVCKVSTEIFSKLRFAGLNYNLPSFFTDSYCAGISNKHCLLTFFFRSSAYIIFKCTSDCFLSLRANTLYPDQTTSLGAV